MSNVNGRQPIGVDQPPDGGTNYPFVSPSSDIEFLFGDFFISYDDLRNLYELPLSVKWLYGFGTNIVSPIPGYPSPVNAYDIIVADAAGTTVFDSTISALLTTSTWDSRLLILEWTDSSGVVRCTIHTEWTPEDIADGLSRTYDNYIVPANGELQADTYYRRSKRVTSLLIGTDYVNTSQIGFTEGYNATITVEDSSTAAGVVAFDPDLTTEISKSLQVGERTVTKVLLDLSAGGGSGVFPGCIEQATTAGIKSINNIKANANGNFLIDTSGCFYTTRFAELSKKEPREFQYNDATQKLYLYDDPLNLPTDSEVKEEAASALSLRNDCTYCCDCEYFARTYQGIKRLWFQHKDISYDLQSEITNYNTASARWNSEKQLREAATICTRTEVIDNCKVNWGMSFGNTSTCCLHGMKMRLTWLYYLDDVLTIPDMTGSDCGKTYIDGPRECDGPRNVTTVSGTHGIVREVSWDCNDPQDSTVIYGRFCFPDCFFRFPSHFSGDAQKILSVKMHVMVMWDSVSNNTDTGEACTYPAALTSSDFDSELLTTWTNNGFLVPSNAYYQKTDVPRIPSSRSAYALKCGCTEGATSDGGAF